MTDQITVSDLATQQDYDILRRLSIGKKCVFEFGSFIGGSALAMLPQIVEANGHLYCVDHFLGNPEDEATAHPRPMILAGFLLRIEPYRDFVTLIIGETKEALHFPTGFADLVFIDASHGYDAVKQDINIAIHLIQQEGIICGHDYIKHLNDCDPKLVEKYAYTPSGGHGGTSYGVIKAVNDIFGKPEHEFGTAMWWKEIDAERTP